MAGSFPSPEEIFEDKYRIVSVINRGGFGRVYHASQYELNRDVAIKVLQPITREGMDADEEAKRLEVVAKRFEREAQLVSQLRDSHTVVMYDYGTTDDGLLYMVLEYVDGQPLNEVVGAQGALPVDRVVKIARQVLSSLEEAHALNMLHRDVKPANIMLFDHAGRKDQVKVLDFGLAKSVESAEFLAEDPDLTGDEVILGTPRYMSPEQIRGEPLEAATDIYSLGLVIYEMLVGEKAVQGESTMNTLARHLNDVAIELPKDLDIDPSLRAMINQMLVKDPSKRIRTAKDAIARLDDWKSATRDSSVERSMEMASPFAAGGMSAEQTKKLIWIGGGVMAFFLVVGLIFAFAKDDGPTTAEATPNPDAEETAAIAAEQAEKTSAVATRTVDEAAPAAEDTEPTAAQKPEDEEPHVADDQVTEEDVDTHAAEEQEGLFFGEEDGSEATEDELLGADEEADDAAETVEEKAPERQPKKRERKTPSGRKSETDRQKKSTNDAEEGNKGGGIGLDIKTLE